MYLAHKINGKYSVLECIIQFVSCFANIFFNIRRYRYAFAKEKKGNINKPFFYNTNA